MIAALLFLILIALVFGPSAVLVLLAIVAGIALLGCLFDAWDHLQIL